MWRIAAILLTIFCVMASDAAAALVANLSVTYEVEADGRTRYDYLLENAADSEFPLDTFLLDTGTRIDVEITAPEGWIVDYGPDEITYELAFLASEELALAPGESASFSLLTPAAPELLPYFLANFAHSDEEDGYLLDFIASPSLRYALHPGDTNADGLVDLTDLNNVRNNFGMTGDPILGDTEPFDGIVDLRDINQVRNNFGRSYNTPVPEPASFFLCLAGLTALLGSRRLCPFCRQ